jgi:very-short-patch-repair endonuclease
MGTRADKAVAELAARQHGVVSRAQLVNVRLGHRGIDHRIALGRLHPVHRGVCAVGHRRITREGAWMAAVLAAGDGAVLSHRSAAALRGIRNTERAAVEVTASRKCRRPRIEAHRAVLPPDEVTRERGIPVTNPARTLLDLAAVISPEQLERTINEAEVRRLASPLPLGALVARHPTRRGTAAIRRILEHSRPGGTITRSELENCFLALVDAENLPRPRMNEPLGPFEPDAIWREERLVVELDSYPIHTTRRAFESDRRRDRQLQAAGYRVIRITWRQLQDEPRTIANELSALLATSRTPPPRSARRARRRRPQTPATRSAAP